MSFCPAPTSQQLDTDVEMMPASSVSTPIPVMAPGGLDVPSGNGCRDSRTTALTPSAAPAVLRIPRPATSTSPAGSRRRAGAVAIAAARSTSGPTSELAAGATDLFRRRRIGAPALR